MEEKYEPKNTCEQTHLYCDRLQYKEITFLERIKLKFHLLFCGPCQQYSKKNSKLTKTIEKANISCLSPQEIDQLKEAVKSDKKRQSF